LRTQPDSAIRSFAPAELLSVLREMQFDTPAAIGTDLASLQRCFRA
jgi:hypothetical protein